MRNPVGADRDRVGVSVRGFGSLEPGSGTGIRNRRVRSERRIGDRGACTATDRRDVPRGGIPAPCYSPAMSPSPAPLPFRIGHGYDLHRLEPVAPAGEGRPFILGGVRFDHDRGPVGHSDGDALLHAITDALLGALGLDDIGQLFPDTDPAWDGADSRVFLHAAVERVRDAGYEIGNLDATVILERPKIGPRKAELRTVLAELLGVEVAQVNLKGKTHERVDAVGEGRAIEVHAVVLLLRDDAEDDRP